MRDLVQACRRMLPYGGIRLAFAIALSAASALFQGVSIGLLLPVLEIIQSARPPAGFLWETIRTVYGAFGVGVTLPSLLLGIMVLITAAQVLLYAQRRTVAGLAEGVVVAVRRETFDDILRTDFAYQRSVSPGTFFNALTQEAVRVGGAIESMMEVLARTILLGFYVLVLFVISWQTSLAGAAIVVAATAMVQYQMRVSRYLGEQFSRLNERLYGYVRERTAAVHLVALMNAQREERSRFAALSEEAAALRRQVVARAGEVRLIMEPVVAGAGLAAIYLGLQVFRVTLAQLAVFLYVLIRILPEAYGLNTARFYSANTLPSFGNLKILRAEARRHTTIVPGPRACEAVREALRLHRVHFAYDPRAPVLDGIDLTFDAGRFTAIVGPSGSGKSTILYLLVRLLDPTSGRVFLDGIDLKEYDTAAVRRAVGLVTQDVVLFNDSVMQNIRYGDPGASEADVIEAARLANAYDFISRLPQGYQTVVGPMGLTLSGGERQRVALARALLPRPSVLLLDEVTSGLDAESEAVIQESIFRAARGRTVVAVSHRLSTVQHADHVVVVDRGHVVEEGSPAALRDGVGLFRRYLDLQMGRPRAEGTRAEGRSGT